MLLAVDDGAVLVDAEYGGADLLVGTAAVACESHCLRPHDVESAARLVAFGMRPKALPARDPGYADLVRRYREDDAFADTVQRVASGLGLVVLAVGPASGLVLAAVEDSVFEIRMDSTRGARCWPTATPTR